MNHRTATLAALALACSASASNRVERPLNDGWQFFRADTTRFDEAINWQPVTLPHTWNATDAQTGSGWYAGVGWYQKDLGALAEAKGHRVVVRFEGAGSVAEVFLNGVRIGEHRGSYAAFAFDLTDAVQPGKPNVLRVKVDNRACKDVLPVNDYLFTIFGGIYRPAKLLVLDPVHFSATDHGSSGIALAQAALDDAHGALDVTATLRNTGDRTANAEYRVNIRDAARAVVASEVVTVALAPGATRPTTLRLNVPHPHRWNGIPDPYLYTVEAELRCGDSFDAVTERWGFRTCEVDPCRGFILNGTPYALHGVCRHQERQDRGNALTEDDHRLDMELVREIGATSVRFAHYQQSDTMYRLCDEMGILAWAEIPFVNAVTGEEWDNARLQLQEMIRQERNHPSIFVWGLHNEVYGKLPTDTAPALTRELNDVAHTEDRTRPTVSVTGDGKPVQPVTYIADLQGFNRYFGWYSGPDPSKLEGWIQEVRKARPDNCIALTEYGAEGNVNQQSAKVPDPFPDPVKGQFYPEIVQTRVHEVQWAILERHPEIWGTYVWNLVDFSVPLWNRGGVPGRNQKGLVTYDRATKKDAFHWYRVNWNPAPGVHVADARIPRTAGEAFDLPIYANRTKLTVTVDGMPVAALERGVNDRQRWIRGLKLPAGDHVVEARVEGDAGAAGATERATIHVGAATP